MFQIIDKLIVWHQQSGRHTLPWKKEDPTGYYTLVSEIMMQQTTVSVGLSRFPSFVETFPSWQMLASATEQEVLKAWEGLGYYRRARFLHKIANQIVRHHGGMVPLDRAARLALPGVGESTASALGAFIYGKKEPIWDANVARVMKRLFPDEDFSTPKKIWQWQWDIHAKNIPTKHAQIWPQVLMDFGALVCTPNRPHCESCPLQKVCPSFTKFTSPQGKEIAPNKRHESKIKPTVWRNWVFLKKESRVAVVPPSLKGFWSDLWAFPVLSPSNMNDHPILASGTQVLSHRIVVWSIRDGEKMPSHDIESIDKQSHIQWVIQSDLEKLPFPKPIADFLKTKQQNLFG